MTYNYKMHNVTSDYPLITKLRTSHTLCYNVIHFIIAGIHLMFTSNHPSSSS